MNIDETPLIVNEFYLPPSEITPILFIGNYMNGAELVMANPRDFHAVLNVSTERPYKKAPGLAYLEVPFDDGTPVPVKAFTACMDFLMFQYETGHRTLVHCAAGISRSVCITAAFMHLSDQMPFDAALNHIKKRRPIAMPHPEVMTSIKRFLKIWPYDGSLGDAYRKP